MLYCQIRLFEFPVICSLVYVFGYRYDTELPIFMPILTTSSYLFYIHDPLLYIFYLVFL